MNNMDKHITEKAMAKMRRNRSPNLFCIGCGEDHPAVIEQHHIYGRMNSAAVVPLCKNCHTIITAEQNKTTPQARSGEAGITSTRDTGLYLSARSLGWWGRG